MDIAGEGGEIRMTLQITRAATGKTESVELVGRTDMTSEQLREVLKNGSSSFDRSA